MRHIMTSVYFPLAVYFLSGYKIGMKLMNTTEAATALGVSVRRVRALIAEGKLSAHRVGRDYAIEDGALKAVKVYGKAGRPPNAKADGETSGKLRPSSKKQ